MISLSLLQLDVLEFLKIQPIGFPMWLIAFELAMTEVQTIKILRELRKKDLVFCCNRVLNFWEIIHYPEEFVILEDATSYCATYEEHLYELTKTAPIRLLADRFYDYLRCFEQPRPSWLMAIDLQVSEIDLDAALMILWRERLVRCTDAKLGLWGTRL